MKFLTTIRCPGNLHEKIKRFAESRKMTMTSAIELLIRLGLKELSSEREMKKITGLIDRKLSEANAVLDRLRELTGLADSMTYAVSLHTALLEDLQQGGFLERLGKTNKGMIRLNFSINELAGTVLDNEGRYREFLKRIKLAEDNFYSRKNEFGDKKESAESK